MTIPTMPRAAYDGGNLDAEAVNDNLRALVRNIRRNMQLRYSLTTFPFSLDGLVDTASATGGRKISLFGPTIGATIPSWQIVGAEVVIYAAAGVTWTLTSTTDTAWPGVVVTTAGDTVEATASTDKPVAIPAGGPPVNFLLTASGASTIVRGYIIFTLLVDRGQINNANFTGYAPTLLSSVSSTAGATLDTQLTAAAAAAAQETAAQSDLRVSCFVVRNLASGGSAALTIPSGSRTGATATALQTYVCGPIGSTITGRIASTALGTTTAISGGLGVTDIVRNTSTFSAVDADAPGTAAQDATITISRGADGGAVAPLCYVLVWFA